MIGGSPVAAQRRTPTRSHCGDRSHAITTAAPLSCPRNSTSHRALTSALDAVQAHQRDTSPPARDAGAATRRDSPVGGQVPFFEFFHNCARTDVQHPRRIANAAGIQGHIDDLLLDVRQLSGVGIRQEKRPSTPQETRTAPIALLAFRGRAMSHNIRALAVGTM